MVYCPYKHALNPGGKNLQKSNIVKSYFSQRALFNPVREKISNLIGSISKRQAVPQQSRVGCSCYSAGRALQINPLSDVSTGIKITWEKAARHPGILSSVFFALRSLLSADFYNEPRSSLRRRKTRLHFHSDETNECENVKHSSL